MADTYWQKQTPDTPLFPDLLWSRPENKQHAGKLLIVGGNLHGFSAPAEAYQVALRAGIGTVRILLPDSLRKTVGRVLEVGEYAPSNPSGSFSQQALAELLDQAAWADGVLFAGDLGHNSETSILIEKFLTKYPGQVSVTKDAIDYLNVAPAVLERRSNTTLVLSLSQFQQLVKSLKYPQPVTFSMTLLRLVEFLHDFTQSYPLSIIVKHSEAIIAASGGQVSTTGSSTHENWLVVTAATAAVWWLQNPNKTFEALTTALANSDI